MTEPTTEEKTKRRVMIVIEDDGGEMFNLRLEGDVERLAMPQIPPSLYSAAEHWGSVFFKMCHDKLAEANKPKVERPLTRAERRQLLRAKQ